MNVLRWLARWRSERSLRPHQPAPVHEPFPPAFLELLRQVVRGTPRLRAARDDGHRSRRRALARSGTFAGHRHYTEGDDLRYVDWNAFARSGELFVKMLEEEDRRTITVVVDTTASMVTGDPQRLCGSQRLAALMGALALARLDGVQLVAGASRRDVFAGATELPRLLRWLTDVEVGPAPPIDVAHAVLRGGWGGSVVWISDFVPPDAFLDALRSLRRSGRRVTGLLPMLSDDTRPTAQGWIRLADPETGKEEVLQVDAALRAAMAGELHALALHQDAVFREAGGALLRFPLPAEGDFRIASWGAGAWMSRL